MDQSSLFSFGFGSPHTKQSKAVIGARFPSSVHHFDFPSCLDTTCKEAYLFHYINSDLLVETFCLTIYLEKNESLKPSKSIKICSIHLSLLPLSLFKAAGTFDIIFRFPVIIEAGFGFYCQKNLTKGSTRWKYCYNVAEDRLRLQWQVMHIWILKDSGIYRWNCMAWSSKKVFNP